MIESHWNFAHATTTLLSWHVRNFSVIMFFNSLIKGIIFLWDLKEGDLKFGCNGMCRGSLHPHIYFVVWMPPLKEDISCHRGFEIRITRYAFIEGFVICKQVWCLLIDTWDSEAMNLLIVKWYMFKWNLYNWLMYIDHYKYSSSRYTTIVSKIIW